MRNTLTGVTVNSAAAEAGVKLAVLFISFGLSIVA